MMLLYHALLLFSLWSGHPLHVSITSVDLDATAGEIAISHKFFTDDFSLLFYHLYEKNIKPVDGKEFSEAELQIIMKYMAQAFFLKGTRDDTLNLSYVKKEQNEDSVWLYFKGRIPEGFNGQFSLTDRIMLDLYEDQTNLVIVAGENGELGLTFTYRNRQQTVNIN